MLPAMESDPVQRVAQWLRAAGKAVVFTGAGMSTESGIPDFRSPGGVWARNKPVYYQQFLQSAEARWEYWRQKSEAAKDFEQAQPNSGHLTIARWEQAGRVAAVITQNIDGLHQMAGSRRVLELHGTAREIECVSCRRRYEHQQYMTEYRETGLVPECPVCSGPLKSATVLFGQPMPADVMEASAKLAEECDLFFAIGSSLVVQPAAGLPQVARRAGAKLVIINRDPTDQDDSADAVIHAGIGATLERIDAALLDSE